jgi:hypothetical protein
MVDSIYGRAEVFLWPGYFKKRVTKMNDYIGSLDFSEP